MQHWTDALNMIASHCKLRNRKPRQLRRFELWCHELEERVTPSHMVVSPHATIAAYAHVARHATNTTTTTQLPTQPTIPTGTSTSTSSSSTSTSGWRHGQRNIHLEFCSQDRTSNPE